MALYTLTKGVKGGDTIIQTGSLFPNSKTANPGGPAFPLDPRLPNTGQPICANTRRLPMASGALAVNVTGSEDCHESRSPHFESFARSLQSRGIIPSGLPLPHTVQPS
jgi:hypothetical protein